MEIQKPNFTIFIPTYNSERYIHSCVESAISQSYSPFKVVVLDSGSTDGTLSILKGYEKKSTQLKIIPTDRRLGIVENWSQIAALADTEWFTILGHDDVLGLDFLQKMAELIEQNPRSNVLTSHFDIIDDKGDFYRKCQAIPASQNTADYVRSRFLGKRDSFATGYVIKTSTYRQVGGIPKYPDLLFADDALWVLLSQDSLIPCSQETLFQYRFHLGSTSGTPDQGRLMDAAIQYLTLLSQLGNERAALKEVLHNDAKKQMLPLAKGYLGLTLLRLSYLGQRADEQPYGQVSRLCLLIQEKPERVLKSPVILLLIGMNVTVFRKPLARMFFCLLPSYKSKARVG